MNLASSLRRVVFLYFNRKSLEQTPYRQLKIYITKIWKYEIASEPMFSWYNITPLYSVFIFKHFAKLGTKEFAEFL